MDAQADWENKVSVILTRGGNSWITSQQRFQDAWNQWEKDTEKKIKDGKELWDKKIKNFLTGKVAWEDETRESALTNSLDRLLSAQGDSLNQKIKNLSKNVGADIPLIETDGMMAEALREYQSSRPTGLAVMKAINGSIDNFNTRLALNRVSGLKNFGFYELLGEFNAEYDDFQKQITTMNYVKMYESFKEMLEEFKESIIEGQDDIKEDFYRFAMGNGYAVSSGNQFSKEDSYGRNTYSFGQYKEFDIDDMFNKAYSEVGLELKNETETLDFLQNSLDKDVEIYYSMQTKKLEELFSLIGGKGQTRDDSPKSDEKTLGKFRFKVGAAPPGLNDKGEVIDAPGTGFGELGAYEDRTYRGYFISERDMREDKASFEGKINIATNVAGAITGTGLILVATNAASQIGTAAVQGRELDGTLKMAAVNVGVSAATSFVGGYDFGFGVAVNAAIGAGATASISYAASGASIKEDGTFGYSAPSKEAGYQALVAGGLSVAGSYLGASYFSGLTEDVVGAGFNSIGSGVEIDGSGKLKMNWNTAGLAFAGNMVGSLTRYGVSAMTSNNNLGSELGLLANATTRSLLGDDNAYLVYNNRDFFSMLGSQLGSGLAVGANRYMASRSAANSQGTSPASQGAARAAEAMAARVARREDEDERIDPLGGMLDEGIALAGDTLGSLWEQVGNFFSGDGFRTDGDIENLSDEDQRKANDLMWKATEDFTLVASSEEGGGFTDAESNNINEQARQELKDKYGIDLDNPTISKQRMAEIGDQATKEFLEEQKYASKDFDKKQDVNIARWATNEFISAVKTFVDNGGDINNIEIEDKELEKYILDSMNTTFVSHLEDKLNDKYYYGGGQLEYYPGNYTKSGDPRKNTDSNSDWKGFDCSGGVMDSLAQTLGIPVKWSSSEPFLKQGTANSIQNRDWLIDIPEEDLSKGDLIFMNFNSTNPDNRYDHVMTSLGGDDIFTTWGGDPDSVNYPNLTNESQRGNNRYYFLTEWEDMYGDDPDYQYKRINWGNLIKNVYGNR